ncbi:MAG: NAD(P)-dependent glycerol-3-phosphate dehydrogenase [Desulfovibrio sp.]|jgi:glycerol-3-phosphate dehydrogenase (NAD(P)+)|nr:NAD(P)-dependent glycerol-3-phosphate dehydrogenase [Desulfovibrio sp.]
MRLTVIGGGSWGTAMANLMAGRGHDVHILMRDARAARVLEEAHENPRYLPGFALEKTLRAGVSAERALQGARLCLLAVPAQHLREVLLSLASWVPADATPVCLSKGIEQGTLAPMSTVVQEAWPIQAGRYAILSGPSFAREVLEGKPTAVVLGCADPVLAASLREALSTPLFRVYSSPDVLGVELGGAMKNVMAIAAGICDGLRLGHNARAGLITRGLAEISRLGQALGANQATFMGLSGLGDLVLTCTGDLSRNRRVGLRLALGEDLSRITAQLGTVAEGIETAGSICDLGERHAVDLPLARAVRTVLAGGSPVNLTRELMARALRDE